MCGAVKVKVTPEETCRNTLWTLHLDLKLFKSLGATEKKLKLKQKKKLNLSFI